MTYIQQLLKGLIDPIILSIINRVPMYGYQIAKELEKRKWRHLRLKEGTIYPALSRLEKKGMLTSRWEQVSQRRGRRYYYITEKGREFLAVRLSEWQDFSTSINSFLRIALPET